jgi:uncharacterized protein YlxW (UPF0749 family)
MEHTPMAERLMTEPTGTGSGRQGFQPNFLLELFSSPLDPGYADAAAARAEHGPRRGWRRWAALGSRTIALGLTGFLFTVAWQEVIKAEPDRSSAHAGLVQEVRSAQDRTDELQRGNDDLRREVINQQRAAFGAASEELLRIREQEAAIGLAEVTGDGALVRLTDATAPIDPTTGKATDADVSRVLDIDVQAVVNGLWAEGAEAIAVNGQRLTSTSTIRTAGSAILVDFRPVTSPYEITAIGPDDLAERFSRGSTAANMRGLAERYGLGLSISVEDDLTLPAATTPTLRHAHPPATASPSGGGP